MTTEGTPPGDTTGTLDEAWERLHRTGPEFEGWLSNHAPMAVEALVRHGQAARVHRWLDAYRPRLEDRPGRYGRVTADNWRTALGDPRHLTDWSVHFAEQLEEAPWREVLAVWWPRLLPGITASATHGVIRVGHAVRGLLDGGETAPRVAELAHALGYWAARHRVLPSAVAPLPSPVPADAALRVVRRVPDPSGGVNHRLGQITALPAWPDGDGGAERARERLRELVGAAVGHYATHAHGNPVMLVHAATAPNAVLRVLPALPREMWAASTAAAWTASAGIVAAYAPAEERPAPADAARITADGLFERAADHGDEHAIKLADTALDVLAQNPGTGNDLPLAAGLRAVDMIPPGL
ncbi:questin oxidase family protein [Streptomyces sp. RFCAC02]|uniref:questin oxidase family protein n=1 Tax=Streptomyces sp. RFCAC02 TaxID=2499143 RepID=UPI00101F7401|nr:questin oxidase family protein [Streptomyces sp. RFCAC02]